MYVGILSGLTTVEPFKWQNLVIWIDNKFFLVCIFLLERHLNGRNIHFDGVGMKIQKCVDCILGYQKFILYILCPHTQEMIQCDITYEISDRVRDVTIPIKPYFLNWCLTYKKQSISPNQCIIDKFNNDEFQNFFFFLGTLVAFKNKLYISFPFKVTLKIVFNWKQRISSI